MNYDLRNCRSDTQLRDRRDLRIAMLERQGVTKAPARGPADVFVILLGLGFHRDDEDDLNDRTREFGQALARLMKTKHRSRPSCSDALEIMRQLGYTRD